MPSPRWGSTSCPSGTSNSPRTPPMRTFAVPLAPPPPAPTNAPPGVVTAAADLTPMVVISGNTPAYNHARDAHQCIRFHADASQGDIFRPFCQRGRRVDDPELLADVMPRALSLAQSGRPGAVLIDVPMDVFS